MFSAEQLERRKRQKTESDGSSKPTNAVGNKAGGSGSDGAAQSGAPASAQPLSAVVQAGTQPSGAGDDYYHSVTIEQKEQIADTIIAMSVEDFEQMWDGNKMADGKEMSQELKEKMDEGTKKLPKYREAKRR